ncbi:preprotein translocase subunit YajC [Hymenobacter crusticola]|uniref:Sec translocon accessory complex subunit YajC n=1 Tax=Hymenobacter crusticola TaxID=1770526 RepID=A0A243W6S3_9BACT|nr:preprotein translocase subunit YajC [Hymenobacter crusticola]OUJ70235.1 preprotein translocase subunit YajC [Hymenobacter crusticola]
MFLALLLQVSGEGITQLIFPVAIALVVYFFMIRPQQRRASEAKKFRESLAKGASVVTIGGLHGKVVDLSDDAVIVEVDKGVRLKFDRTAIAREFGSKTPAAVNP